MNLENNEFRDTELSDSKSLENPNEVTEIREVETDNRMASLATVAGYSLYRISQMPEVKEAVSEKIDDCKEAFKEAVETVKDNVVEFSEKVSDGVKDFCRGTYENVKEFFMGKEMPNPCASQFPEAAKLSEGITEGREFGLEKCSEAALEIFNPGVISEWGNMTDLERKGIALMYADRVAEAFELANYTGVYIEQLEPGVLGYNNGDGSIHLSDKLISSYTTPFQIMDTITHELRHQYQSECIRGYHDVSDEVRNEWAVATAIYNYDQPTCYDPWGYSYNPLEIDSNYAGNTVVRNVSSQMFNDVMNA